MSTAPPHPPGEKKDASAAAPSRAVGAPAGAEPDVDDGSSDSDSSSDVGGDASGLIAPIDRTTVSRLVAGQAVSDLAGAVKELVDNALDAGAGSINVRLFNQGLDIVEVSDDGCGVPRASRPLLAMKHATSKIRTFDDLYRDAGPSSSEGASSSAANADTQDPIRPRGPSLGFRGEALFCLSNVSSKLVVSTRTADEELGQRLEFRRDGYLDPHSATGAARRVGTTVAVFGLFDALPVRRADLIKRIRAQRSRMFKLLQGYGVLCRGVRFNVTDVAGGPPGTARHKTEERMRTSERSTSFEETVGSVLGTKFLGGLCRISVDLTGAVRSADERRGRGDGPSSPSSPSSSGAWRIEGLVSRPPNAAASGGAAARDLQFFGVNGRPVELPPVSRALGDAWRNFDAESCGAAAPFGKKTRPACVLELTLPNRMYDVNLSPDKREVLLTEEGAICELLKKELTKVWESMAGGTFEAGEVERTSNAGTTRGVAAGSGNTTSDTTGGSSSTNGGGRMSLEARRLAHLRRLEQSDGASGSEALRDDICVSVSAGVVSEATPEEWEAQSGGASRMRRRNAFVNRFDNVGGSAPDPPPSNAAADATMSSTTTSQAGDGGDDPGETEEDRRLWQQTKLSFNRRGSDCGQEGEIEHLTSIQSTDRDGTAIGSSEWRNPNAAPPGGIGQSAAVNNDGSKSRSSAVGAGPSRNVALGARRIAQDWSNREPASKRLKWEGCGISSGTAKLDGLKAFAFGAEAGEARRPQSDGGRENELGREEEENGEAEKNGEVSSVPRSVDSSPPSLRGDRSARAHRIDVPNASPTSSDDRRGGARGTDASLERKGIEGRRRNRDAEAEASLGRARAQESQKSAEPKPTAAAAATGPTEPVVWDSFRGTMDVVRSARAARLRMDAYRKSLRDARKRRQRQEERGDPTPGESVGISQDNGVATPMRPRRSKKGGDSRGVVSLTKADFLSMSIVGQFNLGFILARCANNHLWILDQHACDEKYNFERLCANTVMHEQRLLRPLPLELSPSEENCVLDRMDLFRKNGFRFEYDGTKQPRHRLALTALPHSGSGGDGMKAVQFGPEDVGALCAILGAEGGGSSAGFAAGSGTGADGGGMLGNNAVRRYAGEGPSSSAVVRLPKAIAMFASRACRHSIMIGTPLSQKEMKGVVRRMRDVDQPWDCPHGRPTMRHVRDLTDCLLEDERIAAEHVAGPSLAVAPVLMSQADDEIDIYISDSKEDAI